MTAGKRLTTGMIVANRPLPLATTGDENGQERRYFIVAVS